MTRMDQLPVEVVENILRQPDLSIQDILNVSETCSYMRNIVVNNMSVWRTHFQLKWPEVMENVNTPYTNFYEEIRNLFQIKAIIMDLLETMPTRFYKKYELSDVDLDEWRQLVQNGGPFCSYYMLYHLRQIVNTKMSISSLHVVPLGTPGNTTLRYYANKALRFLVQLHMTDVWEQYINLPQKHQLLEVGAVIVAQWCLPHKRITVNSIARKLDAITDLVKCNLYYKNPTHPIFHTSDHVMSHWRNELLPTNQWTVPQCREIITAMRDIIYGTLGFRGNNQSYYAPENSFINEVLETKTGLPITMAIVFESVGRRLGLVFEPINFPAHFLLRFTESPLEWYYIDIFNGGNTLRRGVCPHSLYLFQRRNMPAASARDVIVRMANNLELSARQYSQPNGRVTRLRSILELLKVCSPQDLSALISLAKLYMLHNMNTRTLENYMVTQTFDAPEHAQRILKMLRDYAGHHRQTDTNCYHQVEVAQRSHRLRYAVGMVMLHLTLHYKCVIYDWDPICLATAEWQSEMNVNKLRYKNEQPFYNVIVEDGSYRYVAQENLHPTSDTGLLYLNEDLGRHFSHFFHNHYVPNAEKNREYPSDEPVRHKFHYELLSAL